MPADSSLFYSVLAGIAGLLIGSFLNVCIYRIPRGMSVIFPRSFCPECGGQVAWYDNVPLLGYIFLGGRCRNCRQAIGLQYPLVELVTGVVFALTAVKYGWNLSTLKWAVFEAILIVLFWTDLEERMLPDEFTLGGVAAGILLAIFVYLPGGLAELLLPAAKPVWQSLLNAAAGAVVLAGPMWLAGAIYARLRGREGLGFGDVKLLALLGVFLGLGAGLLALMIGAIAGSVIGIVYIRTTRKRAASYELPFGTFLCAAAAAVVLLPLGSAGLF
ncbi:MAG: prepilin peptidase [Bryobacteraceae bacterium]